MRPRTGTLVLDADGNYRARVTTGVSPDGQRLRPWFQLGTGDIEDARQRLDRIVESVAAGVIPEPDAYGGAVTTVAAFYDAVKAETSESDRTFLTSHVLTSSIAALPLGAVRPEQVARLVVEAESQKRFGAGKRHPGLPLSAESRRKLLGVIRRFFDRARRRSLVRENPVASVSLPTPRGGARVVKKRRAIVSDEVLAAFLACPEFLPSDVRLPFVTEERIRSYFIPERLEMKLMCLVSRTQGGMRTSDLVAWDWSHVDTTAFTRCVVPRTKTASPQQLDIPEVLRAALRGWWEHEGRPIAGPVFPIRRGPRAGQARKTGAVSYAKRLRRELARALRWAGIEAPRELFEETAVSRPVDFHSWRRAYATGLARAGVTVQQAMALAGHVSTSSHLVYVRLDEEQARVPPAALPQLVLRADPMDEWSRNGPAEDQTQPTTGETSAPGRTRTCDRPLRRRLLYPAELRALVHPGP